MNKADEIKHLQDAYTSIMTYFNNVEIALATNQDHLEWEGLWDAIDEVQYLYEQIETLRHQS